MNASWLMVSAALGAMISAGWGADIAGERNARRPLMPYLGTFPATAPGSASGGWTAVDAFPGLSFEDPVFVSAEPGSNRLWVVGRQGTVHAVNEGGGRVEKVLLLDMQDVTQGHDDCGMLALAFHPEFGRAGAAHRGDFYVAYQFSPEPVNSPTGRRPPPFTPGYNRVSRFTLPDGWFERGRDPAVVRASEQVLINQFDEHVWHNLGGLFFGADGFLHVSNGDEGDALDHFGNAQKINDGLFSGVLRIDVNNDPAKSHPIRRQPRNGGTVPAGWPESFTAHYSIPNDNPWVDPAGGNLEEFWAIGLRNPFRMTFDPVANRIWVGDIGQRTVEEVNVIRRAGNYQWAYREGTLAGPKPRPRPPLGIEVPPVFEYGRHQGDNAVIGGYVYRGRKFPALQGKYVFGDNTSNRVWAMTYDGVNPPTVTQLARLPWPSSYSGLSSFGVDHEGEILLCKLGRAGRIARLVPAGEAVPEPPARLSQTGAFADLRTLTPAPGIVPYEVNSPLWSDGAAKRRWLAVPNDGPPYTAQETIAYSPTGEWAFPAGTVFIKHFELPGAESAGGAPGRPRRLETRFLVRDRDGGVYGVTYRWRADGTDADLLAGGDSAEIAGAGDTHGQTWTFPSRADCMTCHNANAGHVLGVNARQLNRDGAAISSAQAVNQLRAFSAAGWFDRAVTEAEIERGARLVAVNDTTAPLATRVRSYLDANCAQCHRPGGVQAYFDARFDTPLARQGLLNGQLASTLGVAEARVIAPQRPDASLLQLRLGSTESIRMPSLARNVVDAAAVATVRDWIASLPRDAGTRRLDRIAVLTNHDVHLQQRSRTGTAMYLSERAADLTRGGGELSGEEIALLQTMLTDPETFVVAHVVLSARVDGVTAAGNREVNGLQIQADYRDTVSIDPAQRTRLAGYWEKRLSPK